MKKDILFLCQFFYPEHNSSATLPFDTARSLAQNGFSVGALCGYPKEYSDEIDVPLREVKDGVEINRVKYLQLKRWKKAARLLNYFSYTVSVLMRIFSIRKYRSIIVYSNPPIVPIVAVLAKRLFGTKIIFVAYDLYPEVAYASASLRKGSLIDRGMRMINRMLFQSVDRVVALTEEMKEFILDNRKWIAEDRILTIANWAHEKSILPTDEAYARFGYSRDQLIVSYFGNMGVCQEMNTLLDAAEQLKDNEDIRFLIIGHGSKKADIEKRICENGLNNVQLHDFLTGEAFEQAVAISSCCVVSLEKGLKGMCAPSKYYSYLQGGKAVVAIVEQGSYLENEIRSERIGTSIEIGDNIALAQWLSEYANKKNEIMNFGKRAGRLYAEKYDREIAFRRYNDMFVDLLKVRN